jgi:acetylornithine deacetylase/succinyl-diaminopimelate desuccinylase-like protein
MTRRFASLSAIAVSLTLAACATAPVAPVPPHGHAAVVTAPAQVPDPPRFELGAGPAFDAGEIGRYTGVHTAIYDHIDRNQPAHLENLRRWLRQPSISAEGRGIREMAEMLRDDLRRMGFQEAELVPTSGHPGVWGYYDAGAPTTLAVYMMYDVQPIEPVGWRVDAFAGEIVDHPLGRALMARGATNQKGPQRAFLNAVESILAVDGRLPVNLMIVAEGEEELGSPNFPEVIERYRDRLRSSRGVIFPANAQGPTGQVGMFLGVKGIVYFEMISRGGPHGGPAIAEVHGSMKVLADSPVLRLVNAIASLTTPDGNIITVPGYYDPIRPPNEEELRLARAMLPRARETEPMMKQSLGIARWIDDMGTEEALMRGLFGTTLNINGIWAGYTGEGVKTILPHEATAKIDSRLVPNQTPEASLRMIRQHLDAHGFDDIVIELRGGYPPAQTSVEAPLTRAVISTYNKRDLLPSVSPRIYGSAPYYLFTDVLGLPMVSVGLGHGSGAHAPNEYMIVEPAAGSGVAGLAEIEKYYVDVLFALAR